MSYCVVVALYQFYFKRVISTKTHHPNSDFSVINPIMFGTKTLKESVVTYAVLVAATVMLTRSPHKGSNTNIVHVSKPSFSDFHGLLDLEAINGKAMEEQSWSANYTARVADEYARFLYITLFHDTIGVPSHDVDVIWHLHILDTVKYMKDCRTIFNMPYLHHRPSYTDDERVALKEPADKFMQKYVEVFGPIPNDIWFGQEGNNGCAPQDCYRCKGPACVPKNCYPDPKK